MPEHDDAMFDELVETQEAERRSHGRGRRRAPKRNVLHGVLPVLLVLLVIGGVVVGGLYGYRWLSTNVNVSTEETDFPGPGSGEALVTVEEGDTGTDIAKSMVDAGVIKSQGPFITQFAASPDAAKIEPGVYRLKKEMSSEDALALLLDPASLAGQRVIIPEGLRLSQIWPRLEKATGIAAADFQKAAKDPTAFGLPQNSAKSLEGYLWPGRYDIPEDATAKDVIAMMTSRTKEALTSRDVPEKDWHRVLTLASLAELEVHREEDYGKVVRTIENRLAGVGEAGGRAMPLQFDSTVHYITGKDGKVATTDADRARDNPYNTYKKAGLPPGPIASPGAKALDAAVKPPKGAWLYFVSVNTDTGETKFATTYAEHQKNVKQWQDWAKGKKNG